LWIDTTRRKEELKMQYIEAPRPLKNISRPTVFLAGGIRGCEDWQTVVMKDVCASVGKGSLLNPRRKDYPNDEVDVMAEQINWEQEALWLSDVIAFWFAGGESPQSKALFELGCHLARYCLGGGPKKLIVGVDPGYLYKSIVELQLKAHSRSLDTPWKVNPISTLDDFILTIRRTMGSLV
jgi:hypothetical protein